MNSLSNVVSMKIQYVGEVVTEDWTDDNIPNKLDHWEITLSSASGHHVLDYFTCLTARHKDHFWSKAVPVKPSFVKVLAEFAKCAEEVKYTFYYYCSKRGYSRDSLKALNVYKNYLDIAQAIHTHFSEEDLCAICDLLNNK